MRVGSLEGRARGAPFVENIFVSRFIREREADRLEDRLERREESRDSVAVRDFVHIVNRHSEINTKSSFSCMRIFMCLCVF
jgi:hypothetical protein